MPEEEAAAAVAVVVATIVTTTIPTMANHSLTNNSTVHPSQCRLLMRPQLELLVNRILMPCVRLCLPISFSVVIIF